MRFAKRAALKYWRVTSSKNEVGNLSLGETDRDRHRSRPVVSDLRHHSDWRFLSHHQSPFSISGTRSSNALTGWLGSYSCDVFYLRWHRTARLVESGRSNQSHHHFLSRFKSVPARTT